MVTEIIEMLNYEKVLLIFFLLKLKKIISFKLIFFLM